MKTYKYIDKVLSHIKSSRRKSEIELELFDHIDENEKFFSEIGYDKTAAAENADGKMGDADIVGEQLNSIKKRFNANYYILSALQITAVIAYINWQYEKNGILSKTTLEFSILDFAVYSVCILLSLICCSIGIKNKHLCSLASGAIGSIFIINTMPYVLQFEIKNLFSGFNLYKFFYDLDYLDFYNNSYHTLPITIILVLLILSVSITGIIILIKTKLLKNTKRDIKRNKITYIISVLLIIATALLTVNTVYQTLIIKDSLISKTEQEVQELNDIVINNAEEFMTIDPDELQTALNRHFKSGDDGNFLYYGENEKYISDYSIAFSTAYAYVYSNNENTTITICYNLTNPFSLNGDLIQLGIEPIEYKYSSKTNEYYICSLFSYDRSELSKEQSNELQAALEEYLKDDEYINSLQHDFSRLDSYWGVKYYLFTNILDITKADKSDIYKIDMTYCAYYPTIHMNEIADSKIDESLCSVYFVFKDGKALITDISAIGDNSKFSERAKENYNPKSDSQYYNTKIKETNSNLMNDYIYTSF
ncbi:MAG: hypothetical protein ACLUFN_04470 [Eubacterium sp.]